MELNEMEKKLLFQVEGDYQTKILNELYMTVRYSNNSEQREAAEGLIRVSVNPPRMGKDYNEKLLQVREQLQTSQHQRRPKEAAVSI